MKYPCEMVRDLLPLYHDEVCSDSSKKIVEEHLEECESCSNLLKKMGNTEFDNSLRRERENVVGHYAKNVKRKSVSVGLGIAALLSIPVLVCLTVNIVTGQGLDWFFIVFTALLVVASVTVVPLVVEEKKFLWTLGSCGVSVLLLLFTCSLYSGGNWFLVAAVAILFGISIVFLPFIIRRIPLNDFMAGNKGLIVMTVDTMLFYALIVVCGFYSHSASYWYESLFISTFSILLPWVLFVIIRYGRMNKWSKAGLCTIFSSVFIAVYNDMITWIIKGVRHLSFTDANLTVWNTDEMINVNLYLLILIVGCCLGLLFIIAGVAGSAGSKKKRLR